MNVKKSIYTSGPIEFSKDAYTWRNLMLRELHTMYEVLIPDCMPCPFNKTDPEYGGWIRKHYIMPDMKDVATANHFFVIIDGIYSSGTYGELSLASWLNKDIVCFLDNDIKLESLPMWILGCLHGATFVDSVEDGIRHYKVLY
jgi:hypothetical protein